MFRFIIIFIFSIALAGCMGTSDETSGRSKPQNPSGIWIGTQSIINDGVYDMKTLIYGGRIYGISEDAGVMYAGTYTMEKGKFIIADGSENSSTSYMLYDLNDGEAFSRGMVGAHVTEKTAFQGSFENDMGQEGDLLSHYTELYEKQVSISDIEGNWTEGGLEIEIDEDGMLTGTLNGCEISGEINLPQLNRNLYALEYILTDCDSSGFYEGLGIIMSDDINTPYFISFAANDAKMRIIGFTLDEPPASFAVYTETSAPTEHTAGKQTEDDNTSDQTARYKHSETKTGVYDNTDFSGGELFYNITDSSYKNSIFGNASFLRTNTYEGYCTTIYGIRECERTDYYTSTISNSDFSGSSFIRTVFGSKRLAYFSYVNENTAIKDSDFSDSVFTGRLDHNSKPAPIYIKPENTDFSGSTFTNYILEFVKKGNNFSESTFNNSIVKIKELNMSGSNFYNSEVHISEENHDFSGSAFNESTVVISADKADMSDSAFSQGTVLELRENASFAGSAMNGVTLKFYSTDSSFDDWQYTHKGSDFSGADLSGSTIKVMEKFVEPNYNTQMAQGVYYSNVVYKSDFVKTDFSGAAFREVKRQSYYSEESHWPEFIDCDFTEANFKNADLSKAIFDLSSMKYANFEGAEKPTATLALKTSYFGNAWWFDGTRCSAVSVGTCVPSLIDTGLSYEEYMSGKSELEKTGENIKDKVEDVAKEGKKFVEDPVGYVGSVFGW